MIQCHPTADALWEIVVCYKLCFVIFVKIFKPVSTKSLKDTHSKHICSFFRVVNMRGSIVISLYSWVCECPGKNFCSDSLVQMLRLFAKQLNLDYVIFSQEQRGMPEIKEEPEEEPVVPPKKLPRVPIKQWVCSM